MMKIKQGDMVEVIAGNDRGQRGQVRNVLRAWKIDRRHRRIGRDPNNDRVIVGGLNFIKKHQRPISQTRTQTGIIEREAPIHISNVALVCPHCNEWTRVGITFADGAKVRICKRCDEIID
jgi:large subunit ribosomal protein L24